MAVPQIIVTPAAGGRVEHNILFTYNGAGDGARHVINAPDGILRSTLVTYRDYSIEAYAFEAIPANGYRFVKWNIQRAEIGRDEWDGHLLFETSDNVSHTQNPTGMDHHGGASLNSLLGSFNSYTQQPPVYNVSSHTTISVEAVFERIEPLPKGIIYDPNQGNEIIYDLSTKLPMCYA